MNANYDDFIVGKSQIGTNSGFESTFIPDFLFPFQKALVDWSIRKGRAATFADCGLGKTPMQLVWAQNMVEHTNKPGLLLTPLSVGAQTVREGKKFGIECSQSRDGTIKDKITITNYQQLHKFNPNDFAWCGCDESSILKNFDGEFKLQITNFMKRMKFRSLWTATAAPNDYIELGTSSEALGELGFIDMVNRFFKKAEATASRGDEFRAGLYRFRGHAERDFWRWVCSWARAVRKPSDLGFPDDGYKLPPLHINEHIVKCRTSNPDFLFDMPAVGLKEQRAERRRTVQERCEMAAQIALKDKSPIMLWGALNDECDLMEEMVSGSRQISGNQSDEEKEEILLAWLNGEFSAIISKASIIGFGINAQHCHRQTYFPSHSFEQWYQAVRRCWRFGQKKAVTVDVISSEGEADVLKNLNRKAAAAEKMFEHLVSLINNELKIERKSKTETTITKPSWL